MTFRTNYGDYEFLVISFELTNASVVFMSLTNGVFKPFLDSIIIVFIVEILVHLTSNKVHVDHLCIFLRFLGKQKLCLN